MGRDESVQSYLADLDNMHKVRAKKVKVMGICLSLLLWMQVVLEVPGEKELRAVTEKLTEAGVQVIHAQYTILQNGAQVSHLIFSAQVVGGTA